MDHAPATKYITHSSYLRGDKQESDCLFNVGTGHGADSDWTFSKQNWIRTRKTQESAHSGWTSWSRSLTAKHCILSRNHLLIRHRFRIFVLCA